MSLLLDTHVVLWWLLDAAALDERFKARLDDEPDVYVSAASVWEVAIKQSLGKLTAPADVGEEVVRSEFRSLAITADHALAAGRLPLLHRDPFDRILVAQAQLQNLTLVTRDPQIARYAVDLLLV